MRSYQKLAHEYVKVAVARGDLLPATEFECVDCGKSAALYEHRDYKHPLQVEPVCNSCNTLRGPAKNHRETARAGRPRGRYTLSQPAQTRVLAGQVIPDGAGGWRANDAHPGERATDKR